MDRQSFMTYPAFRKHLNDRGIPVAEATLRRWVSQGRIEHTKFGKRVLFSEDTADRLLAGRTVAPRDSK